MMPRFSFLLFLAVTAGCQRSAEVVPSNQPSKQEPQQAVNREAESTVAKQVKATDLPSWRPESNSGIPFHLVPLRWEPKEPRLKPVEAVDQLFAGLAEDGDARRLLSELHGNAEVTFIVRKLADAETEKIAPNAPPAKGQAVFWAITDWSYAPINDETEKRAPGRQLHMPVYLGWTYLTHVQREQPNSIPVLVAVINDYLLRQGMGYQLKHGHLPAVLRPMPGDQRPLHEVRAEVDEKIRQLKLNVMPEK